MGKEVDMSAIEAGGARDYADPPPAPLIDIDELWKWSLYRAVIAEFVATLLFLYITVATVIGYKHQTDASASGADAACGGVGILGIAWAFGGMIFVLVYCTAGISGGHINPVVTFGLFLARKVSLVRALLYIIAQCLGAICGVGLVKGFQRGIYVRHGGGANEVSAGYSIGTGLAAEIIGTFVLVYTVFSATDSKRNARDSHVPVLAPLPIGFAVFMVHLATIPITGTGINPARSLGAAVVYNNSKAWSDQLDVVSATPVMKCDDDTFVRLDSVITEIGNVPSGRSLYMGNINFHHRPLRQWKWAVTYEASLYAHIRARLEGIILTSPAVRVKPGHPIVGWIFWAGPFIGAAIAALYHQTILRASARGYGSFRSNA